MSATTNQPTNTNFLSPFGYKFQITKLPNIMYFVQSFDFPDISLNVTSDIQTPFSKIIIPGDHMSWGNFSLSFKIDEDMKDYFELYDWITAIGKPLSFDQYKNAFGTTPNIGSGPKVDGDLMILNSAMRPTIKISFSDIIPVSLSGFTFDSSQTDVAYLTASATFKYFDYTYERL